MKQAAAAALKILLPKNLPTCHDSCEISKRKLLFMPSLLNGARWRKRVICANFPLKCSDFHFCIVVHFQYYVPTIFKPFSKIVEYQCHTKEGVQPAELTRRAEFLASMMNHLKIFFCIACILILALRLAMKEIPRAGFLKDFMMKHGKPYCLSSR